MNNKVAVIINIGSGGSGLEEKVKEVTEAFKNVNIPTEMYLVNQASTVTDAVLKAKSQNCNVIVAAGGDGTLNAVASQLLDTDIFLGILPMGTFNHLARDLNIPLDLNEAVKVISSGQERTIDAGMVNETPFFNNSSIGLYSKLVHYRAEHQRGGWTKRWALIKAILTSIGKYSFLNVEMEMDGKQELVKTPLIFIGNNCYEVEGLNIGTRETLNSGKLCVYVIKHSSKAHLVSLYFRALFSRLRGHEKFDEYTSESVTLTTRKRFLRVAIDGEVVTLESPLRYSIKKRALKVLIP